MMCHTCHTGYGGLQERRYNEHKHYWICFIIIFYVYDLKIYFIYANPFIFIFLVLIVTSIHLVTESLFFSQNNGVVSTSPLLIIIFGFPHFPWERPLVRISAYIQKTFLIDNIVTIYPPLDACFWTHPLQWLRRCQWRPILQQLSPLLAASGPPFKNWPGLIIRWCCTDSARRQEHLQDLASTSWWPTGVRLSSTPQPLGNRGISLIKYSVQMQLLGVEGNSESASIFTGR